MRRGDLRHRPKSRSRILQNPGQGAFLEHAPSTVVCIGLPELALGGGTRVLVTYAAMLTHAVANIMPVIETLILCNLWREEINGYKVSPPLRGRCGAVLFHGSILFR